MNTKIIESIKKIIDCHKNQISIYGFCYLLSLIDAYIKSVSNFSETHFLELSCFKKAISNRILFELNVQNSAGNANELTWLILSPENQKKIFNFDKQCRISSTSISYFYIEMIWGKFLNKELISKQEFKDAFRLWFIGNWGINMPKCIKKNPKKDSEMTFCPYYIVTFILYLFVFNEDDVCYILNEILKGQPTLKFIVYYIGFELMRKKPKSMRCHLGNFKPYEKIGFLNFIKMVESCNWENENWGFEETKYNKSLKDDISKIIDDFTYENKSKNFIEFADLYSAGACVGLLLNPQKTEKYSFIENLSEEIFCND